MFSGSTSPKMLTNHQQSTHRNVVQQTKETFINQVDRQDSFIESECAHENLVAFDRGSKRRVIPTKGAHADFKKNPSYHLDRKSSVTIEQLGSNLPSQQMENVYVKVDKHTQKSAALSDGRRKDNNDDYLECVNNLPSPAKIPELTHDESLPPSLPNDQTHSTRQKPENPYSSANSANVDLMDNLDNMQAIEQSLENQLSQAGFIKMRQFGKTIRAGTAVNQTGTVYKLQSRTSITNARTRIRLMNQS